MKLANGEILHVRTGVKMSYIREHYHWLAADSDGEVFAFLDKPYLPTIRPEECQLHVWDSHSADLMYIGDIAMPDNATREQTLATLTVI